MLIASALPLRAQQATPYRTSGGVIVRGVLFYSPVCPHCHRLMGVLLPPILDRFGDRLWIVGVSTATPAGQGLYQATVRYFSVPAERLGVPTLVVGSRVLVGTSEIPAELPGIVERGLAAGGIDWPDVPQLRLVLAAKGLDSASSTAGSRPGAERRAGAAAATPDGTAGPDTVAASAPAPSDVAPAPRSVAASGAGAGAADGVHRRPSAEPVPGGAVAGAARRGASAAPSGRASVRSEVPLSAARPEAGGAAERLKARPAPPVLPTLSVPQRFMLDPVGNSTAVLVLAFMLAALVLVGVAWKGGVRLPAAPEWAIPTLALLGLCVAVYLAFVETTGTMAVCGPVGHCNTVQQSDYARLFGVLPVGVLGVLGYLAIGAAGAVGAIGPNRIRPAARSGARLLALLATLISLYLTFLEPFVIGASCAWCLTSAMVATLTLLAAYSRNAEEAVGAPRPGVASG